MDTQYCGHPMSETVTADEGTSYCRACEAQESEVERLKGIVVDYLYWDSPVSSSDARQAARESIDALADAAKRIEKERDEARALHDHCCGHGTPCIPPWRKRT